ncbi:hypothetical protein ACGFIR_00890 [Micromonospora sp. NPDC049051]|uniref:hypothetical protein n=1 Tax=unclassified Micromonospora TaxID=2617518 RepID=UPI0037109E0C
MDVAGVGAVDVILPALLLATWLGLALAHRVSGWFFGLGGCVALLCLPAGFVAGRFELGDTDCTPGNLCFSATMVDWWLNGLFGLLTVALLAVLSGVRKLFAGVDAREADPEERE